MKFAIVDGNKVEASKGAKGLCQSCGAEVIAFWLKSELNKLNFYQQSGHCFPDQVKKKDGRIIAQVRSNLRNKLILRVRLKSKLSTKRKKSGGTYPNKTPIQALQKCSPISCLNICKLLFFCAGVKLNPVRGPGALATFSTTQSVARAFSFLDL